MALTIEQVRMFMLDHEPAKNILLDDNEFTDGEITQAQTFVTDAYNAMPPPLSLATAADFPNNYLLLMGVTAYLMKSAAFRQIRNQATAQDGDVAPIGVDDKQSIYKAYGQELWQEFLEASRQYKIATNLQSAYGEMSSGYRSVGRRW